ncbi:hypothetical protein SAMN04489864_103210 [Pedobacter insulae]|uniref:Uncharacterized protein n=1 Tax=Pedobacter insulae TaxID=414048 RepID=A0A1I2VTP9_9SPHI|nr:hypothetical protein SAMN04489864_103210 [Pedobacter insulae]
MMLKTVIYKRKGKLIVLTSLIFSVKFLLNKCFSDYYLYEY